MAYVPAGQPAQLLAPPAIVLNMPRLHAVHATDVVAPSVLPYSPGAQAEQPEAPAPAALYEPAGQAVHPDAPVGAALYNPTVHAAHAAPSVAPWEPEYDHAPHAVQLAPPDKALYWPAAQVVQAWAPAGTAAYAPTAHAVQPDAPAGSAE